MPSPPIPPVEIPRPPVPQEPERLYLLVCDQGNPQPLDWASLQQAGFGHVASNVPLPSKGPTFRRATPDDLHAFGFEAIAPGIPVDEERNELLAAIESALDKLPSKTVRTFLGILQERYGDG